MGHRHLHTGMQVVIMCIYEHSIVRLSRLTECRSAAKLQREDLRGLNVLPLHGALVTEANHNVVLYMMRRSHTAY